MGSIVSPSLAPECGRREVPAVIRPQGVPASRRPPHRAQPPSARRIVRTRPPPPPTAAPSPGNRACEGLHSRRQHDRRRPAPARQPEVRAVAVGGLVVAPAPQAPGSKATPPPSGGPSAGAPYRRQGPRSRPSDARRATSSDDSQKGRGSVSAKRGVGGATHRQRCAMAMISA